MSLPPLPGPPPGPGHHPRAGEAARSVAALLRNDLALRWLALRTLLVTGLCCGWIWLLSGWAEYRQEYGGDRDMGAQFVAVGAVVVAVTGGLLVRTVIRQRAVSQQLHAWRLLAAGHPGPLRPPSPVAPVAPVAPAPMAWLAPGQGSHLRHDPAWLRDRIEEIRQRSAAVLPPEPPPPGPEGAARPALPEGLGGRRAVWVVFGGAVLCVGVLIAIVAAVRAGDPDGEVALDDHLTDTLALAGLGALLISAGFRAARKAARATSTPRRPAPAAPGPQHTMPDALATVIPGGTFDRLHRRTPTAVLATAAGLLGATAMLLLGDIPALGLPGMVAGMPLTVALVIGLVHYERRVPRAVLAQLTAIAVFVVGMVVQDERILAERGIWADARVVEKETRNAGRNGEVTYCQLEYLDGGDYGHEVQCGAPTTGEIIRVLVDPEAEAAPSLDEAQPVGFRNAALIIGAAYVIFIVWGTARGHRDRLRVTPEGAPVPG